MSTWARGRASLWPALGLLGAGGCAFGVALVFALGARESASPSERGTALAFAPEQEAAASVDARGGASDIVAAAFAREAIPPEACVILRVVDAASAPLVGLPVGLIDRVRHPRPLPDAPDPSARRFDLLMGQVGSKPRTAWEFGSLSVGQMFPGMHIANTPPPPPYEEWSAFQAALQPPWPLDGEPATLELHWQMIERATTDLHGEVRLAWDRGAHPLVEVAFAFPTRSRGAADLDARTAASPARLELRAPALARVHVRAAQDLEASRGARWRARVATRIESVRS